MYAFVEQKQTVTSNVSPARLIYQYAIHSYKCIEDKRQLFIMKNQSKVRNATNLSVSPKFVSRNSRLLHKPTVLPSKL